MISSQAGSGLWCVASTTESGPGHSPIGCRFAGIYYGITRRTLTPLLWDVTARVAVALLTAGLMALTSVLFPIDTGV